MIKAILFDFDDTLVKSIEVGVKVIKDFAKKTYNLNLETKIIKKFWHLPFNNFIEKIFKNVEPTEKIIEKYTPLWEKVPIEVFDGVLPSLEKLSKKYLLGIVTSHTRRYLYKDMQIAGIPKEIFFIIQTEEDTRFHKPNPKVFDNILLKLKKIKINKKEILYVGDNLSDYYAAQKAGINFCALADITTPKNKFIKKRVKTINNFQELLQLLKYNE